MTKTQLFRVLFLAVHAAVGLGLRIRKIEDMRQLLLDGGDAARVPAVDHLCLLYTSIRQAITRAIADQARTIRIPVHMVETINPVSYTHLTLKVRLRVPPFHNTSEGEQTV